MASASLGTRPSKTRKEGLVNRLGWKCTLRPVCRCTFDWLLIRNTNRTRAVFAFCFVLERCETKWVRLERFCGCLALQKAPLATEGSTITNIPQCTLPPHPISIAVQTRNRSFCCLQITGCECTEKSLLAAGDRAACYTTVSS